MRDNYLLLTKLFVLLFGGFLSAQVQLNQLSDFGTAIMDINSQGHGIHNFGYYDFQSNSSSSPEDGVGGTSAINDNEEVLGLIDDGSGNLIGAIRVDGVWTAFPATVPLTADDTFYAISSNGVWVTGQTGWDSETDTAWGFVYNTQTEEFRLLESPLYEYSAAYGVNNDGVAVGWVDDLETGTFRMPAIFMPDGEIVIIVESSGEASSINNLGQVVGRAEAGPFIYDIPTSTLEYIDYPIDFIFGASFTGISDTGVVVGYGEMMGFSRAPIVYHPNLGTQALTLSSVLTQFGVDGSGLTGTAYRISKDGNYVAGFTDGPAFMASGWAVNFDNRLLEESECTLICPNNIVLSAEMGESSVMVEYELTYTCQEEEPEGLELVLVSGLPSGSEFPIGITTVYHELRNGEGEVISSCSFSVKIEDAYCTTSFDAATEPITYVGFEEIDNRTTEASSAPKNEYFLDMIANVSQGEVYPITVEGYTGGSFVNYVNVFIDWNQDGEFDETELYFIGALYNSSGDDNQQLISDIQVPFDAILGTTRMRVIKSWGENPVAACGFYQYGKPKSIQFRLMKEMARLKKTIVQNLHPRSFLNKL